MKTCGRALVYLFCDLSFSWAQTAVGRRRWESNLMFVSGRAYLLALYKHSRYISHRYTSNKALVPVAGLILYDPHRPRGSFKIRGRGHRMACDVAARRPSLTRCTYPGIQLQVCPQFTRVATIPFHPGTVRRTQPWNVTSTDHVPLSPSKERPRHCDRNACCLGA